MKTLAVLLAVAFTLPLVGCTAEEQGAAGGAALGAVLGAVVGNQSGHSREGAAIGALAGTIVGYHIGKAQGDRQPEPLLSVHCPHCRYHMGLPADARAGDIVECPNCHNDFVLR